MDQQPPTGDDMRRMLAGMRAHVEDRIGQTRRSRSTARRIGIVAAVVAVLGVGTASGALALGMIPHPFAAAPPATTEAPAPTGEPSPSSDRMTPTVVPTPTPTPTSRVATVPTTCADAVPAADAERLFGPLVRTQVRPVTTGTPAPWYTDPETPFVADAALVCQWSPDGGTESVDNLSLQEGSAETSLLAARLDTLSSRGSTCTDELGGRSCQYTERSVYYGEELATTFTFFVRDGTWVSITQTNTPTDGLLRAVVQQTWGN